MKIGLLLLWVCLFLNACSNATDKKYYAGLKILEVYDSSRKFDTTGKSPSVHRPVKIDLYFPSEQEPKKQSLTYGNILDLYGNRMNYQVSPDSCRKASLEFTTAMADYLGIKNVQGILNVKTEIYADLSDPNSKRPLIIYASGMNGSSWENPILFQSLAKKGYVVAVVSSVGLFPGYMSAAVDVNEQVSDILFTLNKLKKLDYVDSTKVGLLSWSLGGTAAGKAAMLSKEFKCLLSYDGTEIHYYGEDKEWDKMYTEIVGAYPAKPENIAIPYMYLSSEHPSKYDSVSNLLKKVKSTEKYFLKFKESIHENFSSLPVIGLTADPKAKNMDQGRQQLIHKLTFSFFDQYLKGANASTSDTIARILNR